MLRFLRWFWAVFVTMDRPSYSLGVGLRPCPFCGTQLVGFRLERLGGKDSVESVCCMLCGARGPTRASDNYPGSAEETHVERWNRRA